MSSLKLPILTALQALLRPLGYRKSANVFSRTLYDIVHLIEVQSSQVSTKEEARVTVNIGAFLPSLIFPDVRDVTKASIPGAHWRQRLGMLSPERRDIWWSIKSESEAAATALEIAMRVECYALPALAALSSEAALVQQWQSGTSSGITEHQRTKYLTRLNSQSPSVPSVV